jgi:hypothetical protein
MPIIKPAQKKGNTNTKTAQIHKQTLNKQTKEHNIILQEKLYKSTGANPYTLKNTDMLI